MRPTIASLVFIAAGLLWAGGARSETGRCFSSWSEAAQVVKSERLVVVEHLSRLAQAKLGGAIVKSKLCTTGRGFRYRLVVRPPAGPLRSVELDARQPFAK
jgi:hypothetical protein